VAIARAVLKNAPILVLDEATSALDSESEQLVQQALTNLMMDRTSFVIAHRLSTIRRADAIIVLERGRVVEMGRHDELVARPNGTYANLYQMQLLEGRRTDRRMVPS
jgi:ATP-binding cassette subfamily B protein